MASALSHPPKNVWFMKLFKPRSIPKCCCFPVTCQHHVGDTVHVLGTLGLLFLDFWILCCANIIAMDVAQNTLEINHVCYSTQGLMDYFSIAHFKLKTLASCFSSEVLSIWALVISKIACQKRNSVKWLKSDFYLTFLFISNWLRPK